MSKNLTELLASIPMRDETIFRALADIEHKLSAWSAAVADCDYAPGGAGNGPVTSAAVEAPAQTNTPATCLDATTTSHVDAEEAVSHPTQDDSVAEDSTPAGAVNADDAEYDVADFEPAETPIARPASPDDDESVLVGLSPESAKAIKVQWRLLEGSKSLRQLVEEHKARLVRGDAPKDGKRSWWARGKG